MADTDKQTIHCPIGKWYFKRMSLLGLLLIGFGCWFLYDAVIGYPKGAVKAVTNEAFKSGSITTWEAYSSDPNTNFSKVELDEAQLAKVKDAHAEGGKRVTWSDYCRKLAKSRNLEVEDLLEPADGSPDGKLKEAFLAGGVEGASWDSFADTNGLSQERDDRVIELSNAFAEAGKPREWKLFAAANDLPSKDPHFHGKGDILEQYLIGGLCAAAGLIALVVMLLNRNRAVSADAEAYYPKPSVKVLFSDVFKIDTRKWRRKGLAYAYYRSDLDGDKKAIIDDLKFVGSQGILDRILANFEGELIEEVIDETPEAEGDEAGEVPDEKAEKAVSE